MIRNPYASVGPGKKRKERPWKDVDELQSRAPSSSSSSLWVPVEPKTPQLDQSTPSTGSCIPNNKMYSDDDDNDGGIDWSEAVRLMDDESAQNEKFLAPNTIEKSCNSDTTIYQTTQSTRPPPVPLATTNGILTNARITSSSILHRQHHEQQNQKKVISSLRPPSWSSIPTQTSSVIHNAATTTSSYLSKTNSSPASTASQSTLTHPTSTNSQQSTLPPCLQFDPASTQPIKDEYRKLLVKNANLSEPLLNGWTLYPHQKKAILRGILLRRIILALDMGLGKTLISCVWSKAFVTTMSVKVIIICPVSLQKEWKRTAEEATGLSVLEDHERWSSDTTSTASQKFVQIVSWSKIPPPLPADQPYVVVADEAHSIQNMEAARTQDTLKLVAPIHCVGVLMLTGTPMKNGKPSNLFPLLRAVRHPLGKNQRAYETHFCAGRDTHVGRGRVVWNASGSSHLEQLHQLTQSHLLYMSKEDCLKDLPPQTRVFQKVPVSSRRKLQHQQALQELARVYAASQGSETGHDAILGAVQRVRMVGSMAKIEPTVELAQQILQTEPALVIFTSFCEVAKQVHSQLAQAGWKGELLTGETPPKKRQGLVDNFQKGLSAVFCCTFGAGGVGLTLTAARTVILLDRPWTPGDAHQAEDRTRRIGQTHPVKSIWVSAFDLDEQIDAILEQKKQTAATVLMMKEENEESTRGPNSVARSNGGPPPKLSIFQMLKSILPDQNGLSMQRQQQLPFVG